MAHPAAEIFLGAARLNRQSSRREGNVLRFGEGEHLIVAGDIHGHRQNLNRIIRYAQLTGHPKRMLVLQEIIHGGPTDNEGGDRSFEVLLRAARLKVQHSDQVHFLLGNHDQAQIIDGEITKDGHRACLSFDQGLAHAYGDDADEIAAAIDQMLLSMPLAGRCPNGVMLSHSLPSAAGLKRFDPAVFNSEITAETLCRGGGAYELLWGRHHDAATLDRLAEMLAAGIFINGHQPQDNGFAVNHRQLIIASEHPAGVIAEFRADEPIEPEMLGELVRKIVRL